MQSLSRCCIFSSLLLLSATACEAPEPSSSGPATIVEGSPSIAVESTPAPGALAEVADAQAIIQIDGSSTVFPITEAVADLFERSQAEARVQLGVSGTGGGFRLLCAGKIDIADASRPIKESEQRLCRGNGVEFVELPVAFDGISVVVHADNHWCRCLTVEELTTLWAPQSQGRIQSWSDLRPLWPHRPLQLFAPGTDSGTFDYFTHAILEREGESRSDFIASEDDYLLAQGVAESSGALGFFGFAYYREYQDSLGLVAIDQGAGCVAPSERTIADGTYRPLSRPIFLYVRAAALERPEVEKFVAFYLRQAAHLVPQVGYVPLPERAYDITRERLASRRLGTLFAGGSQVGLSIDQLLQIEAARGEE